jgi:receptor protein-tyrosine kinase
MGIIEQAAKRLEELRQSGLKVPEAPMGGTGGPIDRHRLASDIREIGLAGTEAESPTSPTMVQQKEHLPTKPRSKRIQIDLGRLAARGFVTPDMPSSRLAEEFRIIKRPLIRNATGKGAGPIQHGNLIMLTSALPGEGKSFCAVNLSISIAMELDTQVLLVDADVAKPSLAKMFEIDVTMGLLDVLSQKTSDLGEVLLRTNVDKLSIVPSGTAQSRATELLASDAMARLVDELAERYPDRIVIFDSPPLLVTTEASVLATHMGQLVIVVEAGRTTHAAVRQALAMVEACPVKLMMLNKSSAVGEGSYYGYHAHKGYGRFGYGN